MAKSNRRLFGFVLSNWQMGSFFQLDKMPPNQPIATADGTDISPLPAGGFVLSNPPNGFVLSNQKNAAESARHGPKRHPQSLASFCKIHKWVRLFECPRAPRITATTTNQCFEGNHA